MRASNPDLDTCIGWKIDVLDHGYVTLLDYMGTDRCIVKAARVSYGADRAEPTDAECERLIEYLMRHEHTSPFEMCEIKFQIKAPIFVARQIVRHRTASINEVSARYTQLPEEYYLPNESDIGGVPDKNKQGRMAGPHHDSQEAQMKMEVSSHLSHSAYSDLVEMGIAPEIARNVLPVNTYTTWVWKINAHNFMRFLKLRNHDHAQYETRMYAQAMQRFLTIWLPITAKAFENHVLHSKRLSQKMVYRLRAIIRAFNITESELEFGSAATLTDREKREFNDIIGI